MLKLFVSLVLCLPISLFAALSNETAAAAATALDGFRSALKNKQAEQALAFLDEDVLIYESGHAENRSEYAAHHLKADIEFASAVTGVQRTRKVLCNDICVITSQYESNGQFRDKTVHNIDVETAVLKQREGKWQIVHLHWSSRKAH